MMTLDELKHEAELHGYRLVKKRASMKKVPCICGNKQISLVRDLKPVSLVWFLENMVLQQIYLDGVVNVSDVIDIQVLPEHKKMLFGCGIASMK